MIQNKEFYVTENVNTHHFHEKRVKRRNACSNSEEKKSSLRNWTNEIFLIKKVFITDPVTYELEDLQGEKIEGIFYREEIQKI